jgi:lipoate-protein ligase A
MAYALRAARARRSVVAMATRSRPRSALGAISSPSLVNGAYEDLYDYDEMRRRDEATMFHVQFERPTLVLGGSQSPDVLARDRLGATPVRRRRGGGGLVLLQPDDLWVDWWIPAGDPRWSLDVRVSSVHAGRWWRDVLVARIDREVTVHEGPLEGDVAHRLVCFAGRGPGEVFVDGRKAVGLTQWRVREGIFISTVIHAHASNGVVAHLKSVPVGLIEALDHQVLSALRIDDLDGLVDDLRSTSGPWRFEPLHLTD